MQNNQGKRPVDLTNDPVVRRVIDAAEKTDNLNNQKQFFDAVASNDIETITRLVTLLSFFYSKNRNLEVIFVKSSKTRT